MAIRVAINGYGRIGRNVLRALYEAKRNHEIEIVAINDLGDVHANAHLTRYDSTHGRFDADVRVEGDNMLVVNNDNIRIFAQRDPSQLPWKDLNIDVVYECTGLFTKREAAQLHLTGGAKKVLISAPAGKDVDATIVYGVNHHTLKASDNIVSNASCTTNCLAPVVKPLHQQFGIEQGLMTTIHAYTNDQVLVDSHHKDLRRARSATQSMIPTKTGAAAAVGLVLPELDGRLDGFAIRVPVVNVSVVDLTFTAQKPVSIDSVNQAVEQAAKTQLAGVLAYNDEPLVSVDFNHHAASSVFDATQTRVIGNTVKVLAWYDNEWGFSNRMLDTSLAMMSAGK
jgi:glyceraldehyde 3-phosphate dehydrogenase